MSETVLKLGFRTKPIKSKVNKKSKKPVLEVWLDRKEDQKVMLGLAYYANNLIQNMMMDACIGRLLDLHQFSTLSSGVPPLTVDQLIGKVGELSRVLRNEFLERDPRTFVEAIAHRLRILSRVGEIKLEGDRIELTNAAKLQLNPRSMRMRQ